MLGTLIVYKEYKNEACYIYLLLNNKYETIYSGQMFSLTNKKISYRNAFIHNYVILPQDDITVVINGT